jgi:hypothetical protein
MDRLRVAIHRVTDGAAVALTQPPPSGTFAG